MLLGKRPRPQIKRTTSLSEISFDPDTKGSSSETAPEPSNPFIMISQTQAGFGGDQQLITDQHRFLAATVSPRTTLHRRASVDFLETASFLKSCFLCKRRLVPSRDIYMYRGDSAFCSLECRQQQMNIDERKDKCSLASKKGSAASTTTTSSEVSANGAETVAAV